MNWHFEKLRNEKENGEVNAKVEAHFNSDILNCSVNCIPQLTQVCSDYWILNEYLHQQIEYLMHGTT